MSHCSARPGCPTTCICGQEVKRELGIAAGLKPDLSRAQACEVAICGDSTADVGANEVAAE